jgi:galactokinase/mevalonate kinase-like predicted kinase
MEKRGISNLISNRRVDKIVNTVMDMGAYGAKLLGSGGCGFVIVACDPFVKHKIKEVFKDNIMEFNFSDNGVTEVLKH